MFSLQYDCPNTDMCSINCATDGLIDRSSTSFLPINNYGVFYLRIKICLKGTKIIWFVVSFSLLFVVKQVIIVIVTIILIYVDRLTVFLLLSLLFLFLMMIFSTSHAYTILGTLFQSATRNMWFGGRHYDV